MQGVGVMAVADPARSVYGSNPLHSLIVHSRGNGLEWGCKAGNESNIYQTYLLLLAMLALRIHHLEHVMEEEWKVGRCWIRLLIPVVGVARGHCVHFKASRVSIT